MHDVASAPESTAGRASDAPEELLVEPPLDTPEEPLLPTVESTPSVPASPPGVTSSKPHRLAHAATQGTASAAIHAVMRAFTSAPGRRDLRPRNRRPALRRRLRPSAP
jgi:hypothetical protein